MTPGDNSMAMFDPTLIMDQLSTFDPISSLLGIPPIDIEPSVAPVHATSQSDGEPFYDPYPEALDKANMVFELIDLDNDGVITEEEAKIGISDAVNNGNMDASDAIELSNYFNRADQIDEKDGQLTFDDAVEYISSGISAEFERKEMAKRIADAMFASAEKDHEEKLSAEVGERALEHAMEKGSL